MWLIAINVAFCCKCIKPPMWLNVANCHLPSIFFITSWIQLCMFLFYSSTFYWCFFPLMYNVIIHGNRIWLVWGCSYFQEFLQFTATGKKNCGYTHHRRLCNATGEKSCFTTFLRGILYVRKQSKILAHVLHSPLF